MRPYPYPLFQSPHRTSYLPQCLSRIALSSVWWIQDPLRADQAGAADHDDLHGLPPMLMTADLHPKPRGFYPCHVSPREMRTHPIGTGPFKFGDFRTNEII